MFFIKTQQKETLSMFIFVYISNRKQIIPNDYTKIVAFIFTFKTNITELKTYLEKLYRVVLSIK